MLFSFQYPEYLIFLLVVPLLFIIHLFTINNRKKRALSFANFDSISRIKGIDFFSKNWVVLFLSCLIVISIVLAVSGLIVYAKPFHGTSLYSFTIAIDSSKSMLADDMVPNRMQVAKESAVNFVQTVPMGTKISIISFGSFTYIEQELTINKNNAINSIQGIEASKLGGTDLYEAVFTSSNLLTGESNKAIILLSDGQVNTGYIEGIIDYAKSNRISIYSIILGTDEGGDTGDFISKVDSEFLEEISLATGGRAYQAKDNTALAVAFTDVLRLTKERTELHMSQYLMIFALILFLIKFFLINTRYFEFI